MRATKDARNSTCVAICDPSGAGYKLRRDSKQNSDMPHVAWVPAFAGMTEERVARNCS